MKKQKQAPAKDSENISDASKNNDIVVGNVRSNRIKLLSKSSIKALMLVALICGSIGSYVIYKSFAATPTYGYLRVGVIDAHTGAGVQGTYVTTQTHEGGACYSGSNNNFGVTGADGYVTFHCAGLLSSTSPGSSHGSYVLNFDYPSGHIADPNHGGYITGSIVTIRTDTTCQSNGTGCYKPNGQWQTVIHYTQQNRDGDNLWDHNDACPTTYALTSNGCPAATPPPAANVKIYRMYNAQTQLHIWVNKDTIADAKLGGYVLEGAAFDSPPSTASNVIPVYRLYNPRTYLHHYVTTEGAIGDAETRAGYKLEGIAYYAKSQGTAGTVPVHQLYQPSTYKHFWTIYQGDIVMAQQSGYNYEAVAFNEYTPAP